METTDDIFLPGVPAQLVREALRLAGGNELESGKLASSQSSAALAVNAFGWFLERPAQLPPLPGTSDLGWPALGVGVERQMRFPWSGGRHPWLDAAVETEHHLIGVESKRYEPFRDAKAARLSEAYDRDCWGSNMKQYTAMRDALRSDLKFRFLDAAQLVKHAFGLVSEGRRIGKALTLFYLHAEPTEPRPSFIASDSFRLHREEIDIFAAAVRGAEVGFAACSYREWLDTWPAHLTNHAEALITRFQL